MLKELIDKAKAEGGATYNYLNSYYPTTGFVVSTYKDKEQKVFALDEEDMIFFIHQNYDLLMERDNCIGIWWNKGFYYLDVVTIEKSYGRALTMARNNAQIAIYNLDEGKTVDVTDTPEFEFDELYDVVQEQCIIDYLETSTMYEVAIDDLRHMKFGVNGNIVRGYDE